MVATDQSDTSTCVVCNANEKGICCARLSATSDAHCIHFVMFGWTDFQSVLSSSTHIQSTPRTCWCCVRASLFADQCWLQQLFCFSLICTFQLRMCAPSLSSSLSLSFGIRHLKDRIVLGQCTTSTKNGFDFADTDSAPQVSRPECKPLLTLHFDSSHPHSMC